MLLRGLTWLVLFQLLGTALNVLLMPKIPGPILGLLLLLLFMLLRGQAGPAVTEASTIMLRYLPLMLVPPAVGIMLYANELGAHFWAVAGTLVLSVIIGLLFCGGLMQLMIKRQRARKEHEHDA